MVTNGARICAFMFYRLQYNQHWHRLWKHGFSLLHHQWLWTSSNHSPPNKEIQVARHIYSDLGHGTPTHTTYPPYGDTSILIWAFVPACIAWTAEAFYDQLWLPFLNRSVFYILWANLFTTTRSAMSKMLDPSEVGKAFSFLGVLESGLSLIIRPIFGLLYRETVDIFPGTWVLVSTGLLTIALGLIVVVHVGTKETNSEVNEEVMNKRKP